MNKSINKVNRYVKGKDHGLLLDYQTQAVCVCVS